MLIRKRLWAGEFSNPALRYDADCDCVQITPDGGDTWINQPANDPRTSDAYRLPALTGDDVRCRAAEGMTALVRAAVDARLATDGDIQLAGEIIGLAAFIPGFNVLYALVLAFAFFAVTIAKIVLEESFTEEVYDQIRCIFYCNIGEDGQMSQAQWDAAYADLIDLGAIARTWCQSVFNLFGPVGLSDAGVKLEGAADCDCECEWCYQWDFTVMDGDFAPILGEARGEWVDGLGWHTVAFSIYNLCQIERTFASSTLTQITLSYNNGLSSGNVAISVVNSGSQTDLAGSGSGGAGLELTWTGSIVADTIVLQAVAANHFGDATMYHLLVRGIDENPFGENNC